MNNMKIIDFPKIECPFVRTGEPYLVTPQINEGYEWVFEDEVIAVDKIDGTNVCLYYENDKLGGIANRTTEKTFLTLKQTNWESYCLEGINNCLRRGWGEYLKNGYNYGELIGEHINTNRHQMQGHLFVPFEYLKKYCCWHSWEQNKYPKTFESISEWFKTIPSLFNQRMKLPDILTEGLVFYHKDGRVAKIRRSMFHWFYD